jgi:hypothetical protein
LAADTLRPLQRGIVEPVSSGSDYESSMPKRLDRLLVLAAAVLLVAISWDTLARRPGSHTAARPATTEQAVPEAPVPDLVRLVPSSTAFLPRCPARDLHLTLGPGPLLTLRFAGGRCHVPPLHLRTELRHADGTLVYRGPALAHEDLSGNYAGSGVARARLLGGCPAGLLRVRVSGSGLAASGPIRCP